MTLEFRDPALLLLALAAIPVYLAARRPAGRIVFSSLRLLPPGRPGWRARLAFLPAALLALAAAGIGVAIAGPRVPDETTRVQRKGIAILMAIDCSGSMRALDLSTEKRERTRLDAVKDVFESFVAGDAAARVPGRPDDAIGLVTFARYADCRCPLTLDHRNLLLIARDADFVKDPNEDGTALGDGLGLALERLRESKADSKVAILLTDGVSNCGDMTPLQAAQVAEALGIRVYTVGAGTEGFAPIRVEDPYSGRSVLRRIPCDVDEKTLEEIAKRTGGRYFRATDAEALRRAYQEIDRLERSQIAEVRYLQYHEYFEVLLGGALACAGAAWLLGASVFRRLP
jgi:Ca-activated chloride channel family protein